MHIPDIETLLTNREVFNEFVYTPLSEAVVQLSKRGLENKELFFDIPTIFNEGSRAVLFRQGITSNYEVRRFISITDASSLTPIFIDHSVDKFVAKNEWKYFLGKVFFYLGKDKFGQTQQESIKIINFDGCEGKIMTDIKTLWGQSMIDFHRELFLKNFPHLQDSIFDASVWLSQEGGAAQYYKKALKLFIKNAILFENFLLDDNGEAKFIKDVFLPAFIHVIEETGYKPLIVALEPTDIEGESFWMYHPPEEKGYILSKLHNNRE